MFSRDAVSPPSQVTKCHTLAQDRAAAAGVVWWWDETAGSLRLRFHVEAAAEAADLLAVERQVVGHLLAAGEIRHCRQCATARPVVVTNTKPHHPLCAECDSARAFA